MLGKGGVEAGEQVGEGADGVDGGAQLLGHGHGGLAVDAAEVHEAGRPRRPGAVRPRQAVNQHVLPGAELAVHEVKQGLIIIMRMEAAAEGATEKGGKEGAKAPTQSE